MDEEEYALWNLLDIKGFGSNLVAIAAHLETLQKRLRKKDTKDVQAELESIEIVCNQLAERIFQINPADYYSGRYPVETIVTIKKLAPTYLREIVRMAKTAAKQKILSNETLQKMRGKIDEMAALGSGISTPEYQEYRKIIQSNGEQGRK